jgi:hypothetical protein
MKQTTQRCGYWDLNYLLLNAHRIAATKTEFIAFRNAA